MLERGDLVRGTKPWNRDTALGIILAEKVVASIGGITSFKIHWVNSTHNTLTQMPSFITWEVSDSLEKIQK